MSLSTRNYFEIVAPHLPPALVKPEHSARISRVAERLPPSSNFGFECHLGSSRADADFLVAVIEDDGSRAAWADGGAEVSAPEPLGKRSPWTVVGRFLADWHHNPRLSPIRDSWLEFDLPEGFHGVPEPSLFFGYSPGEPRNYPELSLELIERLRGCHLSASQRDLLSRCFAELPEGGVIFQVGLLLARPGDDVRLCIRRLSRVAILDYLEAIGWPGSRELLRLVLEELAAYVDGMNLDLSVSTTVRPAIGLECVISDGSREKTRGLLGLLQRHGMCRRDKATVLFDWLGYSTEADDFDLWPAHLLKGSRSFGSEVMSTFARTLNHFKIGILPNRMVAAKAYLGVRHFWARRTAEVAT
ncbi:MAG: hypothetical protein MPN21_13085 [Thermoanaerobaculia bacterium]|nr:hypothetical protein [Thermoanaerobaculia bacterium]